MSYRLGIDLGTTYTAAAVLRDDAAPEALALGTRTSAVPSVLFLDSAGSVLFGEAAEDAAPDAPERVARHFKRRIGDPVPLVLGRGTADQTEAYAHDLAAAMIAWVVAVAAAQEGSRPAEIAVTHPAGWGQHKRELLRTALAAQNLPPLTLITEPEAAAVGYARTGLIPHPAYVAVYDLGGGTLDVALLEATGPRTFRRLGEPRGIERVGGIDFDDALLGHVLDAVGASTWAGDDGDTMSAGVVRALAQLRAASVAAKETLSTSDTATVSVQVDDEPVSVELNRAQFDDLISAMVTSSTKFFLDTITGAGLRPADLSCVLLTGGSVQVPLVTEHLADVLPEQVSVLRAVDPKAMVAAGAVLSLLPAAAAVVALPGPRTEAEPAALRGPDLAIAQARAFFQAAGTLHTPVAPPGPVVTAAQVADVVPAPAPAAAPAPGPAPAAARLPAQAWRADDVTAPITTAISAPRPARPALEQPNFDGPIDAPSAPCPATALEGPPPAPPKVPSQRSRKRAGTTALILFAVLSAGAGTYLATQGTTVEPPSISLPSVPTGEILGVTRERVTQEQTRATAHTEHEAAAKASKKAATSD